MTIPNLISALRIILVPIFVIYLLNDRVTAALVVFILAGLSDVVDGLLARVLNQKSNLGSYLDPLADKILLIAAFICLAIRGFIPSWITVIVISRDILILLGALILILNDWKMEIRPFLISKVNTCAQIVTVFVVLSENHIPLFSDISEYIFWITGILTISSGLQYMRYWFKMMGENNIPEDRRS